MSVQRALTDRSLPSYLASVGFVPHEAGVRVEPVGDGNINWVRRVHAGTDRFVVKQARPALERFPEYRASTERIVFEARFYQTVAPFDAGKVCPEILFFDPEQKVLVLEDLGNDRLDAALAAGRDPAPAAAGLGRFLGAVHAATREPSLAERFRNDEMRRLHGDHIFFLPYRPNDFPLTPAVAERAAVIRADRELVATIDAAYERYLEPRGSLLHGDVQPANVLLTGAGPRLLDAEIAHVGDPAFDVGQLVAHLLLPAAARGEPTAARPAIRAGWDAYCAALGDASAPLRDVARYAGIELLRRTLGAARVPALEKDAASLAVLGAGVELIREGLAL